MTINDNIRTLRLKKRLSQENLGEMLGVSGQAVSKWEQGITSPDISLIPALAECFGVTIDSLFDGTCSRKYPGYGSERNELLALYTSESGTDEDFRLAKDAFDEVILSGKATTEDYNSYAILHRVRANRDNKLALYYYRRAISEGNEHRDEHWMSAHQMITNLFADMGRVEVAVKEHRKWVDEEPDCAWAYVSYSYALERAGRLNEAWDVLSEALRLDSEDFNVRTAAGDMCAQRGQYDEAIVHWDKAYELNSLSISCLFSKAEMFASMGEKEKAIKQFEEILVWLEEHGFNMELESVYPLQRIEQIKNS